MGDFTASGQCLCGKVSYTISGEPLRMAQCHCKGCQRVSGTGHASIAFFKDEQLDISGETSSFGAVADSGNTNTREFCAECGSWLFNFNSARSGIKGVLVGCVDDNSWFDPAAVVYCKDRSAWDITSTEVPNFDAMPPAPPSK